jgi:alcohol dehydrogenase
MDHSVFCCPPISLFGKGSLSRLADYIAGRYKKALLVTDGGIVKLGLHQKVANVLDGMGLAYVLYGEVKPNPTFANALAALKMFKRNGCDVIVSVGGGSAIDCGKAVSILAVNEGDIYRYVRDEQPAKAAVTHIAVATTAGSGSEATHSYVITDEDARIKYGVRDRFALPAIAVNDAELIFGLPKSLTAATGMDALTHAVESLIGPRQSYLTQEMALSAVRLTFENLPAACENPNDAEAREKMSAAQYLAGLAFGNANVGLTHCMSHQLSAVYDTPHGIGNAALLPACLRFQKSACLPQLARIARSIWPIAARPLDEADAAELTIEKIARLSHRVGTDPKLAELGLKAEDISLLAEKTLLDGSFGNCALAPTAEQARQIFIKAM